MLPSKRQRIKKKIKLFINLSLKSTIFHKAYILTATLLRGQYNICQDLFIIHICHFSQLICKILFTTGKLNTVLLRNLHRNDLMFLLFWTYLQKGVLCVLAINNPNIQNVSAHAHTDKMVACFKNIIYSTVSFIALSLIVAESAVSSKFSPLSFVFI